MTPKNALALAIERNDWERAALLLLVGLTRAGASSPRGPSRTCSRSSQNRSGMMPRFPPNLRRPPGDSRPIKRFYASVVDEAELVKALEIDGIDDEIAILRVELRTYMDQHKEGDRDLLLMNKGIELIARIVAARYRMSPSSKEELGNNLAAMIETFTHQLFPEKFTDV